MDEETSQLQKIISEEDSKGIQGFLPLETEIELSNPKSDIFEDEEMKALLETVGYF